MKALAESLIQFDRGAEAVVVIDDCVRRSAGQVVPPKLIPGVMDLRLRHFEKAKDAAGCRATAEMWENLQRTDAASLYTAARYRAVTAAVLRAADTPPPAAEQAGAEADRAMTWLKRAVAAEYKDVADIRKNKDLDVLRNRADFREAGGRTGGWELNDRRNDANSGIGDLLRLRVPVDSAEKLSLSLDSGTYPPVRHAEGKSALGDALLRSATPGRSVRGTEAAWARRTDRPGYPRRRRRVAEQQGHGRRLLVDQGRERSSAAWMVMIALNASGAMRAVGGGT